ncbi:MAG: C4-dicarboxylate ABC transporter permease [Paracoccaceae bacterium]|nr:MAG: C4-dicarboxylate ABC transporter permease [Paracoccaceae bacterium]
MPDPLIGVLGFAAALALIAFRVPIAVAMGVSGVVGFGIVNGFDVVGFVLGSGPFEAIFPYSLSVIPLFLLMGVVASHAGLSTDLFAASNALFGRLRGGLAIATIGACAGFGAICGSSLATVATMGRVALPEMRKAGYDDRLTAASIAAAGTLGVLIPPSILLVIYGLLTEQSIGRLFSAAILPGILATTLYALAVAVQVRVNPALAGRPPQAALGDRLRALRGAGPVLLLFVAVIGGIQIGLFSPTEAAAVGAGGAIAIALARRALNGRVIAAVMRETVGMTGMIFFIMIGAALFNYFIETTGLPQFLVGAIGGSGLSPLAVLLVIMVFYIVLGCFMDAMSMILLTVPFVFPVIVALGFDPIWFGVVIVTVAELGLITPPVGMNLFVIQGVAGDLPSGTVMRGIVPFLLADMVRLAVLIALPQIALWLPGFM